MSIYIETKRLILREFIETDVINLFKLDSNPIVHKYLGNNPAKNEEECFKYIQDCIKRYKTDGICRLALIEKETNTFIGWSGLRFIDNYTFNNHTNFYDVGYRLMPEFWNKGYATESGKAAVKYGFETMKLKSIYGLTHIKNEASHQALLKIGLNFIEDFYYKKDDIQVRWYKIENK